MYKPRVYTASKVSYYKLWKTLAEDPNWDFIHWTASWPRDPFIVKEIEGEPVESEIMRENWIGNVNEIIDSDFVLLYTKPSDQIRGTIFEAGVAIGRGIPVLLVGEISINHSWIWYPHIKLIPSLREARDYLYRFTIKAPARRKGKSSDEQDA